ncbi:type II secretion system GspH family protein [Aeromonas veronii]|nr:type II secretion system GspH family protein [Aeromonas veronii]
MRRQAGFTLFEMIITLVIFGILSSVISAVVRENRSAWTRALHEREHQTNIMVSQAIFSLAGSDSAGALPEPYTGGGVKYAPLDPSDSSAKESFIAVGLSDDLMNSDGTAAKHPRIYQRVSGLSSQVPVFGNTGDRVTLDYEVGVIYSTNCIPGDACDDEIPGDSAIMTANNYSSWTVEGDDYRPVWVSSFSLQKDRLRQTIERINTLQNKAAEFYQQAVLGNGAGKSDNFHVTPTNAGSPDLSGREPIANGGCRRGWYKLADGSNNIVSVLGLDSRYASDAWGNSIEYCNDYDPAATGVDTPPHTAAFRLVKRPRKPDGAYVIFSF